MHPKSLGAVKAVGLFDVFPMPLFLITTSVHNKTLPPSNEKPRPDNFRKSSEISGLSQVRLVVKFHPAGHRSHPQNKLIEIEQ